MEEPQPAEPQTLPADGEVNPDQSKEPGLKKVLSYKTILLITINSIMGTGIFFLPAVGARTSGPASIISWAALAVVAIYISMIFGELTSMFPKAGGVYEFCKQAYGRFWSFMIGWMTLLAGNITIAMLVVGAIQYLLPVDLPFVKIGLSLFFVYLFNYIAYKGMKTSAVMLVAFAIITIGTVSALIIPGLFKIDPGNFTPFFVFPTSALIVTIFLIAETFFGWETATFLAAETKDGARVMPKALIVGTIIIAGFCLLSVITSLGVIPWEAFGKSIAPLSDLGGLHYGAIGIDIFTILVYVSIIGSVAGWIVAAPRLILAMAEDKLFLSQFAKIHPKYGTPYKAILLQTIVVTILVFAGAGSYETLLHLLVPMVLIMYSAVLMSLVVLRYKLPDITRYYKAPFGKVGPILVTCFMMFLIYMWATHSHGAMHIIALGSSFILIGIPLYFLLQMYYSPKAITFANDFLMQLTLITERLALPKRMKKEIGRLLGDIKGKSVLEYGCNVGTLTLFLSELVGTEGKVYATTISQRQIKLVEKRLAKEGIKHVDVMHDPEHHSRLHPNLPDVSVAVSVGGLGYVQDLLKVLHDLNRRLDVGDKICFVDYDKFFDVIPNIDWLSNNDEIRRLFEECGFKVEVKRKQGFAWQYIFIYGEKDRDLIPE